MIFPAKTITLKDGRTAILRSATEQDAATMLNFIKTCSGETHFILRTPEECTETVEQEANFLRVCNESADRVMIACFVDGEAAGNCQLSLPTRKKIAHRATVAIALLKKFWNLGIGTAMFEEMIALARQRGRTQMELEVIEGNERAKALYRKMGFVTAARKPNAIRLDDGTLLSEDWMYKQL